MDHSNRRHRTGRLCVTVPGLLLALAPAFAAPVQTRTRVLSVSPIAGGHAVRTDRGAWRARGVILATGAQARRELRAGEGSHANTAFFGQRLHRRQPCRGPVRGHIDFENAPATGFDGLHHRMPSV